jgi:GntR family transcriptional regulator
MQPGQPIRPDNRRLYARAIEALRLLIESNRLKAGDRMPSEDLLAKQLGISRSTLREAMGHLETQGFIVRKQGVGTFVSEPIERSFLGGIEQLESFRSRAIRAGLDVSTAERRVGRVLLPQGWDRELREPFDGEMARMEAVQSVAGRRIAYFDSYLPLAQVDIDELEKFEGTAIEYFNQRCEAPITHTRSGVFAIRADRQLGQRFLVPEGEAILHLREVYYTSEGTSVGVSLNYFLTDAFHFYVIRQVIEG